jgi:hypothetical protein
MLVVGVVATMANPKMLEHFHGGSNVFFPRERLVLALPFALLVISHDLLPIRDLSSRWLVLIGGIGLFAFGFRQMVLVPTVAEAVERSRRPMEVKPFDELKDQCDRVARAARETGVDLIVDLGSGTRALACSALNQDSPPTIFPRYERRTWMLEAEVERVREHVLLVGVDTQRMAFSLYSRGSRPLAEGMMSITPGMPILTLMHAVGARVRPPF